MLGTGDAVDDSPYQNDCKHSQFWVLRREHVEKVLEYDDMNIADVQQCHKPRNLLLFVENF